MNTNLDFEKRKQNSCPNVQNTHDNILRGVKRTKKVQQLNLNYGQYIKFML